jgi:PAS domain S-box-containing protein
MAFTAFRGNALKTRISILAVAIFVIGIWTLSLYVSRALREDLQRLLGQQQLSTAQLVAAEINQEIDDRRHGLESNASQISPKIFANADALQKFLDDKRVVQMMFSGGLYTTGIDGTVNASVPASLGRKGSNFRAHLIAALEHGQTAVSEPVEGKFLKFPLVSISTPIRDPQGRVMGALVGVINLKQSNFLDRIVDHRYGQTGGYLIVDAGHHKYVTATDKRYVNQSISPGASQELSDPGRHGDDSYGLATSAEGVALLVASSHIPAANWHVVVQLPVAEAFSPIQSLEWRIFAAATVLTLLAGALMWWVLGVHLQPLAATARELETLSRLDALPDTLPVPAVEEIGQVVTGFNHLLAHLRQRESALQQSEQRFRTMTEGAPLAISVHHDGRVVYVNPAALHMFGAASSSELLGRPAVDFVHPSFRGVALGRARAVAEQQVVNPLMEQIFLRLDGSPFEVEVQSCAIVYDGANAVQVTMRDLSTQREHEEHLRKLSRITEQAPMAIAITNLAGTIEYTNPWFSAITGYSAEELLGKNPRFLKSGQTDPEVYESLWRALLAGKTWQGEFHNRKKNGELFIESATVAPVQDPAGKVTHYVALKQDVTLRKQTEAALRNSVRDKVALLHEVHHRVKNNLQVITSMLRLEAARSAQPETRSVLKDMQSRIRSMALLHETLYRSGTFAAVDLASYIKQLATQAYRAQDLSNQAVSLQFDLQSVAVDMDLATPCGLLVNELLTNSLKHGFPDGRGGEIRVHLQPAMQTEAERAMAQSAGAATGAPWHLCVSDNGIGLPADFETQSGQSLGLQLVADLVQQMHGRLVVEPAPGAGFSVFFTIQAQKPA